MTEKEFLEKMEQEKLFIPNKRIVLNSGLIEQTDGRYIFGCTKATKDSEWFIFHSELYLPPEYETETLSYIELTDKNGKIRKVPYPMGVHIHDSFKNEEDALDEFYKRIKEEMRIAKMSPEEFDEFEKEKEAERWSDPKFLKAMYGIDIEES